MTTSLNIALVCATLLAAVAVAARSLAGNAARRAQHQRELAMHERAQAAPTRALAAAVEQLVTAARALEQAAIARGPSLVGHRVTVHIGEPDDLTVFGVVVGDYEDRIALEDAELVTKRERTPLPGRQDIETARIAWVDVHAHVATARAELPESV